MGWVVGQQGLYPRWLKVREHMVPQWIRDTGLPSLASRPNTLTHTMSTTKFMCVES
jgi:hypothetical protein